LTAPQVYKPPLIDDAARSKAAVPQKLGIQKPVRPAPGAPVPASQRGDRLHPVAVVQRYKTVAANAANYNLTYTLRVSNDGKMAVRDTGNSTPSGTDQYQDLYLATEVFNASQATLQNANSGVTLVQTNVTIKGKPKGKFFQQKLYKIDIQFSDTGSNDKSYTNCNTNMWHVMGTQRGGVPDATAASHGYFKSSVNQSRLVVSQGTDAGSGSNALVEVRKEITGLTKKKGRDAWDNLTASERDKAAKKYGINQYAKPKAGEGIGIYQAGEQGGNTSKVMAHFAGVIARSGGDYITLENFALNPGATIYNKTSVNKNWYVRMFGSNQSFYEYHEQHEQQDYGDNPMAVRFRKA